MDKDKQRRAAMTIVYVILVLWFAYAAYTEFTGKWVTFPVSGEPESSEPETAAPAEMQTPPELPVGEELNNG